MKKKAEPAEGLLTQEPERKFDLEEDGFISRSRIYIQERPSSCSAAATVIFP